MNPNTFWRPIFWEPVAGTGERFTVGVVVDQDQQWTAHRLIRDDVLDCLYGKSAPGVRTLIDTGLNGIVAVAEADPHAAQLPPILGLEPGPLRHTYAASISELLRTAALLYSSMANLDCFDELDEPDAPIQEEANRRFSTEVRALVVQDRPDLDQYFGRSVPLVPHGDPVRFGFSSPHSIIHFGVLHIVRQPASVRDARARLWELARARDMADRPQAALIMASPRRDDPTLSARQLGAMSRNLTEIEREADSLNMRFLPVTTVAEGAGRVIEYA